SSANGQALTVATRRSIAMARAHARQLHAPSTGSLLVASHFRSHSSSHQERSRLTAIILTTWLERGASSLRRAKRPPNFATGSIAWSVLRRELWPSESPWIPKTRPGGDPPQRGCTPHKSTTSSCFGTNPRPGATRTYSALWTRAVSTERSFLPSSPLDSALR